MGRQINRLIAKQIGAMREPGLFADGQGLYLRIDQTGARRWVFIFHRHKKRREMGLGSAEDVTLARARAKAEEARGALKDGKDPIEARRRDATPADERTFRAVLTSLLDSLEPGWKSPKQRPQWQASLDQHALALMGRDVAEITTDDVVSVLNPIWNKIPETASRVRGRIERVLDAAKARGLRVGENPARLRGHLSILLASSKREKGHHAAMPYGEVPAFVKALEARKSVSALALRFLILTATRSGEVRGATWDEIKGDTWIIPKERMKAGREHRVPLSKSALELLETFTYKQGLIFPGLKGQLSDMALAMVIRKKGLVGATPHGFRSSFRDWAGDCTGFAREVAEQCLAHQIGDKAEQAYRRGDALEKRRQLMAAWADFVTGETGKVIELRRS